MSYPIQQVVMAGFHVAIAVGIGACLSPPGVACGDEWCSDRQRCYSLETNGDKSQLMCVTHTIGESCNLSTDCAPAGICDTGLCRVARSCAEILQYIPGSKDGTYSIAPSTALPFSAVCDMTRDGGGWTLLLKATGDSTLEYSASAWTDDRLLNETDLTTQPGNAKYQSFLSLPVTTLRGELDGFTYRQAFAGMTAQLIFTGGPVYVKGFPTFNYGAPYWSTQPNCQVFGVNTPYDYAKARFGWSANDIDVCQTNDTAIGLGLMNEGNGGTSHGAGYECLYGPCSQGKANNGGNGLLWAK